ncbi:MAG TPA: amidase, partial [Burkholderiaceae bacterium]|nr:amidase [Burkholderiaceae bacterium]
MFAEYPAHDGIGLAELIRRDEVSAGEVLQAALARLEQLNPRLNAVTLPMADYAHAQLRDGLPDGPFRGVPVLLKDLLSACAGVPTRSGNRLLKNRAPPAQADSALIARLRASGVVFIGKTNTAELGLTPYTEPAAFGPTHNPARHGFSAGGSSGGSAAAVAAGIVPIATGGDGGGSLRIPASCCGVFAMKPTRGRTPTAPAGEHWGGLAIEHVLTRSVRDSAAMLDVLAGPEPGAPYAAPPAPASWRAVIEQPPPRLRIAFSAKPLLGRTMHADCVAGLNATVSLL